MTAQTILAILWAVATTALCLPRRCSIRRANLLRMLFCLVWFNTLRPPWISSVRKYLSPRLDMPWLTIFVPLAWCLGVSPSQAAKPLALLNCLASPTRAISADVVISPRPGMLMSCLYYGCAFAVCSIFCSMVLILVFDTRNSSSMSLSSSRMGNETWFSMSSTIKGSCVFMMR